MWTASFLLSDPRLRIASCGFPCPSESTSLKDILELQLIHNYLWLEAHRPGISSSISSDKLFSNSRCSLEKWKQADRPEYIQASDKLRKQEFLTPEACPCHWDSLATDKASWQMLSTLHLEKIPFSLFFPLSFQQRTPSASLFPAAAFNSLGQGRSTLSPILWGLTGRWCL